MFFSANSVAGDFHQREHQVTLQQITDNDIQAEIEFGQNIAARILGRVPLLNNPKLTEYVNLVGQSLASNANRPELGFRFAVLDADFVNAYSTPGGYVFITRGALQKMEDESELAAVLAHEIAHIGERHIVNSFKIKGKDENENVTGAARLLSGGKDSAAAAFLQALDQAVDLLFKTGFNHDDEYGADTQAILLLASTGYDVHALKRYLKRVDNRHSTQEASTHPISQQRFTAIDDVIKSEGLNDFKGATAKSRFKKYSKGG
ncbi:MAG: M48 family metalloprotease [Gammaproteobacteria bacterium]|nr:M48 family metalloprotease [Gammaproteobacteria bacterium]